MKSKFLLSVTLLLLIFSTGYSQIGYDLNHIVVTPGATNPVEGINAITNEKQPSDSTLDIVNWNLSFFGAPSYSSKFKGISRDVVIDSVAKKMVEMDADVYALQEIVVDSYNGNALTDLLNRMNELAGKDEYGGSYSQYHSQYWNSDNPDFPSQCLAFIWKKETVSVNKDSALLQDETSYSDFAYKRLPYMIDANVTFRGKTQRYFFINIHLKAQKGYSEERANSMALLHKLLKANFSKNNVVLLGDYNVADDGGAIGEISNWGMYNDDDSDGIADYVHVAGDKNNGIEHTLISNELYVELAYISKWDWNITIDKTKYYSDHSAYMTSLYVFEETGNTDPGTNSIYNDGNYKITMSTADYQIIADYVKNDPVLAALDNSKYDDSEYYFGASAYYSNFDIRDGKHNSTFATWQDAIQTAISLALLPAKYPDAEANDSIYSVTFDTYSGSDATYTFTFKCTQSAPDPKFAYTDPVSAPALFAGTAKVYPNPATNVLYVTLPERISAYTVRTINGSTVKIKKQLSEETTSINLSSLATGLYLIEVKDSNGNRYFSKFLKK
jgi:endonuclease/exonuclease/phosphatase family metal-dependent hydrolase